MENIINFSRNLTFGQFSSYVAAIGVFDGVHRGHRQIIKKAFERARSCGAGVIAVSFSPHPRSLFFPQAPPELLMTESQRAAALLAAGADDCVFINFTPAVASLEPEIFLEELKNNSGLNICGICVGSNWRFGAGGRGNRELLAGFCKENNWSFDAVQELEFEGETISSSAIRKAVAAGQLERAASMQGYPVQLTGVVEHGFHIATDELAAPTANLRLTAGVMVPDGVYSGSAVVDGKRYPAALNIGVAPTYGNGLRRIEIHLIGFSGSLYGRELCVELYRFLRPEKRFASPDELRQQIAKDISCIMADCPAT